VAWIADTHGEAIFINLLPTPTWVHITWKVAQLFWLCGTEVILKGIVISKVAKLLYIKRNVLRIIFVIGIAIYSVCISVIVLLGRHRRR
jgi:hypothetical protein